MALSTPVGLPALEVCVVSCNNSAAVNEAAVSPWFRTKEPHHPPSYKVTCQSPPKKQESGLKSKNVMWLSGPFNYNKDQETIKIALF